MLIFTKIRKTVGVISYWEYKMYSENGIQVKRVCIPFKGTGNKRISCCDSTVEYEIPWWISSNNTQKEELICNK